MTILKWLRQPEASEIEALDHADTVAVHAGIIKSKGFLRLLYIDFYRQMGSAGGYGSDGLFVEIGSGGGFIKEILPNTITSDVVCREGVDRVFSAESMPFPDGSVNGIFVLNCFHHFSQPALALREFDRVLVAGGSVVMIEPANTPFSRMVYTYLHHELFDPSTGWTLPSAGRLSGANGALSWIVFVRDAQEFARRFPSLTVAPITCHTPFSYLISGGLTWRQLAPTMSFSILRSAERVLSPVSRWLGMFMTVIITKGRDSA